METFLFCFTTHYPRVGEWIEKTKSTNQRRMDIVVLYLFNHI